PLRGIATRAQHDDRELGTVRRDVIDARGTETVSAPCPSDYVIAVGQQTCAAVARYCRSTALPGAAHDERFAARRDPSPRPVAGAGTRADRSGRAAPGGPERIDTRSPNEAGRSAPQRQQGTLRARSSPGHGATRRSRYTEDRHAC